MTLITYFEDQEVFLHMKKILEDTKNKRLLLKYEESLPSWTVVMA
jgi:hypothetical protein